MKNRLVSSNISAIDEMNGLEFEKKVAKLLSSQGYRHIRLTEKYDLGVDIIADRDNVRWGIQVKRNKGLVKAIAVRQVVTALKQYKCDRAMLVTNSVFSNVAKELAKSNNCLLIDRNKLLDWL
ncbi:MAG TPA: restriction endonuclease [Candidatus Saccharimonadales bacterium]